MRILLILLVTITFLILVAAVLIALNLLAHAGRLHEPAPLEGTLMSIFGSWFFTAFVFLAVAVVNIWFVFGPLMKVDDPASRTLQHLSIINIQVFILFAITGLAALLMSFPFL